MRTKSKIISMTKEIQAKCDSNNSGNGHWKLLADSHVSQVDMSAVTHEPGETRQQSTVTDCAVWLEVKSSWGGART
ncbi:hypothetical protein TrRE_jg7544 [Triparma retinervis]|uniref:Uncharacterized protein n=1 Tax=Triparma retinervis TaxID=2557542 RepID=A0A9W6ZD61_9STRA|nr:hypothetical protein TrRE_jg7544 [Triparma retinervis]